MLTDSEDAGWSVPFWDIVWLMCLVFTAMVSLTLRLWSQCGDGLLSIWRRGDKMTGEVRRGVVRKGKVRRGEERRGEVRRGEERRGEVRRGEER